MLARIVSPHFVAGIVLSNDVVAEAAPIVAFMMGWQRGRVRDHCRSKAWNSIVQAADGG
jgi:hypothetical protein